MSETHIAPHPNERLTCPKCGCSNAAGSNGCAKCGAHLYVICRSCGHGSPRSFRKCKSCGHSLHRSRWKKLGAALEIRRLRIKPLHLLFLVIIIPIAFKAILVFIDAVQAPTAVE